MQPAVQRPLEPTRISYSRTKIPATLCLPLDPEGMFWRLKPKHHLFHVNLMSAALLRIGHLEMKIWENLVCHLVFSFFPWLILIRFDATDQSHLRKLQLLQLPEIHCTNSCLKTNFQGGLLHEEEKRISCEEDTSTHLFFVHLFAHDLRPHAQVLTTS